MPPLETPSVSKWGSLVVDRARPLVAPPGDGHLPVGVADPQGRLEAGDLAAGKVLDAVA